ncbi:MAG: hypothetical protein AB1585_09695 [Thermodesulfobacteriota bacterium]
MDGGIPEGLADLDRTEWVVRKVPVYSPLLEPDRNALVDPKVLVYSPQSDLAPAEEVSIETVKVVGVERAPHCSDEKTGAGRYCRK